MQELEGNRELGMPEPNSIWNSLFPVFSPQVRGGSTLRQRGERLRGGGGGEGGPATFPLGVFLEEQQRADLGNGCLVAPKKWHKME